MEEEPDNAEGRAVDWSEVRRVYELTETPTVLILKQFGLTPSQLRWRRESENWEVRPPAPGERYAALAPTRLKSRLLALHGTLTARLEGWIAASEHFLEDQARALTTLAAFLGHIAQTEESEDSMAKKEAAAHMRKDKKSASTPEKKNHNAATDFRDDPAWLNAELDRRIARLTGRHEGEEGPGERDG